MKTRSQILMGAAFAALLILSSVSLNAAVKVPVMESASFQSKVQIKRIVLKGNVRVKLIQSKREWVGMEEENLPKVSVRQMGDILTISSTEKTPVEVNVHVRDIYRIDAAGTTVVATQGTLKLKNLQVFLRDKAIARISTYTESLYTLVNKDANLFLKGSTDSHTLNYAGLSNINLEKFNAVQTNRLPMYEAMALNTRPAIAEPTDSLHIDGY